MPSAVDIALLDEVIAAAWRAPVREELDGWQLRYGYGLTGRANSVWPRRDGDDLDLGEKIVRAEDFYARRSLLPKVMLSPASRPAELDDELETRGYARSGDVLIETAEAAEVERGCRGAGPGPVVLAPAYDDAWGAVWLEVRGEPPDRGPELGRILGASRSPDGEALARIEGVAIGRVSISRGHATIGAMATVPAGRRRGAARAVLRALAAWALERGAERLVLNVDAGNESARALYESVGFEPQYAYWYRTAPA